MRSGRWARDGGGQIFVSQSWLAGVRGGFVQASIITMRSFWMGWKRYGAALGGRW